MSMAQKSQKEGGYFGFCLILSVIVHNILAIGAVWSLIRTVQMLTSTRGPHTLTHHSLLERHVLYKYHSVGVREMSQW